MVQPSNSADTPSHTRARKARRWLLELGVVGVAYALLSRWQNNGLLRDGSAAPDFELADATGRRVRLSDYADKQVVLHFWATWCGVCRQEFGMLNALERSWAMGEPTGLAAPSAATERDVVLLALAAEEDESDLLPFLRQHAIEYPVLLAPRQVIEQYRVSAFPTTYYLNSSVVQAATVGMSARWAMRARLACA